MKKIILLAVCLVTLSTAVTAQQMAQATKIQNAPAKEKMTPDQRAQKNVDKLNEIASLSEDQKVKIKELALNRITKADEIRAKYKGQKDGKALAKKEMEAGRKEYRQSVKATLTPEQLEKMKSKAKEMKAQKANQKANATPTASEENADHLIDAND